MPDAVRARLTTLGPEFGIRCLLIRHHRADQRAAARNRSLPGGMTVFAAYPDPERPWLETGTLQSPDELLDLDYAGLAAGRSAGLERTDEPVFAVCTQGRHDPCCARRGRPVAAALAEAYPDHAWETSHMGGDRFAGNMLVLPHGLYYGRLTPDVVGDVIAAHLRGELLLDHLRGRSGYAPPSQVAEIALRRSLGEVRHGAVRRTGVRRSTDDAGAQVTTVTFDVDQASVDQVSVDQASDATTSPRARGTWTVAVTALPPTQSAQLTCHVQAKSPIPNWSVAMIGPGSNRGDR